MNSIDLLSFMAKNRLTDQNVGLTKLVNHTIPLAPQLPEGLGNESPKSIKPNIGLSLACDAFKHKNWPKNSMHCF